MGGELPEGFTVDEPTRPTVQKSLDLPEGFTLDSGPAESIETPDYSGIIGKFQRGELQGTQLAAAHELNSRGLLKLPDVKFGEQMSVAGMALPTEEVEAVPSHEVPFKEPLTDNPILNAGKIIMESVAHVPESAARVAKEMFSALSPIPSEGKVPIVETAKAVTDIAMGGVQKLLPGEQEEEATFDAMVDAMKSRYGSEADILQTIQTDPVGVAGDISALLSGVGAGARVTGAVPGLAKVGKVGKAIQKAGAITEPVSIAKKVVGEAIGPLIASDRANKLYQSAVKFSTTLPEGKRKKLASTALDNEIMPTYKGLGKLRDSIDNINTEISSLIDKAQDSGKKMYVTKLFNDFNKLKKEASLTGAPIEKQKAIRDVKKQIIEANKKIGRKELTPKEAQKLKQNIYRDLDKYYNKLMNEPAKAQAQKAVAKQAKLFLEEVIPEIKSLNKTDGDLIELYEALDRPVSRIANRDIIGIGTPMKGTTGGVVGGAPGMAAGIAMGIFDMPTVKSKLAIVLNKLKKKGVTLSPMGSSFRSALYEAGKAENLEIKEEE